MGLTPKQAYISGESCYKKLRNSPAKMKYRDNWSQCIQKFQQVYRLDPGRPLGGSRPIYVRQALPGTGEALGEKIGSTGSTGYLWAHYQTISKQPLPEQSRPATQEPFHNEKEKQKQPVPKKYVKTSTQSAADKYNEGESCYRNLKQDSSKLKYRHNWMPCIDKFYDSYLAMTQPVPKRQPVYL